MNPEELFEKQLRRGREYRDLFDATAGLLLRHDPIQDHYTHHADEYKLEAQEIVTRLRACQSVSDVTLLVHKIFVVWRGEAAGPLERYEKIGQELWHIWEEQSAT